MTRFKTVNLKHYLQLRIQKNDNEVQSILPKNLEKAKKELKEFFQERCTLDESTTQLYGKDCSFHKGTVPDAVCYPKDIEEIKKIVQICSKYRIPIIPFGFFKFLHLKKFFLSIYK